MGVASRKKLPDLIKHKNEMYFSFIFDLILKKYFLKYRFYNKCKNVSFVIIKLILILILEFELI